MELDRLADFSESNGRGIRGRLSSHARGRGNKDVATRLRNREKLWFIASPGIDGVDFENLFLVLIKRSAMFTSNRRDEMQRYSARLNRRVEEQMRAEGKAIINFTDILEDYYRS